MRNILLGLVSLVYQPFEMCTWYGQLETTLEVVVLEIGVVKCEGLGAGFATLPLSSSYLGLPPITVLVLIVSSCVAWPAWSR